MDSMDSANAIQSIDIEIENSSDSSLSSTTQHQASVFHNFQKHLTIALRMIVTLNHIDSYN